MTPLRIALALTRTRTIRPSITARTFWRLGLNLRGDMPVILVPTPPRYFALPRMVFWRPMVVFLPVKWHSRGMAGSFRTTRRMRPPGPGAAAAGLGRVGPSAGQSERGPRKAPGATQAERGNVGADQAGGASSGKF